MADSLQCFHCGADAAADSWVRDTSSAGKARIFCCEGCKAVYQLIQAENLEGFYDLRTDTPVTPTPISTIDRERLSELDHPLVQRGFVSQTAEGNEAQVLIGGLSCAACIWLLERHLGQREDVRSFSINYSTQRARLVYDPEGPPLSQHLLAIHELGYTARPYEAGLAEQDLKRENRSAIIRLVIAGIGSMQSMMLAVPLYFQLIDNISADFIELFRWFSLLVATPVVFYSAAPFFQNALRDIRARHLTMDVPVATAIGLAYTASVLITVFGGDHVYFESVCMFTFFLSLGRYLEARARYRAGLSGTALGGYQPAVATRIRGIESKPGEQEEQRELVTVHDLSPGDRIRVKPGETLPADGVVVAGRSNIDEAALTGEYMPVSRTTGDFVHAGTINGTNSIDIEVVSCGGDTRLSGILRILDRVQAEKPPVAQAADRMAGVFISRVLIITPLIFIGWWLAGSPRAFDIALSVLVVTCPCALSLATPTALTSATYALRRIGLLPTKGQTLEAMATVDTVVFDKTGTLTSGRLSIQRTETSDHWTESEALSIAAGLEQDNQHPIARAFSASAAHVTGVEQVLGKGLVGMIAGQAVWIGHRAFMHESSDVELLSLDDEEGLTIWLVRADGAVAKFVLNDQIRADAKQLVADLQDGGYRTVLLSGDHSQHVRSVANYLGIGQAVGRASPEDKLAHLKALTEQGHRIMMVGDGLNDLPSMAGAQVSIAMGSATDLTQTRADAVLLGESLAPVLDGLTISRRVKRIIRQNLAWALGYNVLALPLAAAGFIPPWLAALGMSLSSLIVVLNALRLSGRPASFEAPELRAR